MCDLHNHHRDDLCFLMGKLGLGRCSRPRAAVAGGGVLGLLSCPLLSSIASALHLPTLAALLKHKLHLHIFIFSLVKWTHYPFWQVGSSQLDCKLLKGRSYVFCISFASLRLVSRPFYLVRERSKKSFFPFIISAGHGTHSALLQSYHPCPSHRSGKPLSQVDGLLVFFETSYIMLS